ncbi:hypothetical protein [Flavobacterium xanthum]|uniref:Uncharacterized protein n=1 Tax=Flavobacterium xanthum TaxID=69322 RepID=A0A1M7L3Q3_9FLAO|nr:hypothetical protein [Flavobacterium xanthum]SHM71934.1 hypothetical protein SAMN05443669_10611 [Flavobacterium xanthum]
MNKLSNLNVQTKIFVIIMIVSIIYAVFYLYKNFNVIEIMLRPIRDATFLET